MGIHYDRFKKVLIVELDRLIENQKPISLQKLRRQEEEIIRTALVKDREQEINSLRETSFIHELQELKERMTKVFRTIESKSTLTSHYALLKEEWNRGWMSYFYAADGRAGDIAVQRITDELSAIEELLRSHPKPSEELLSSRPKPSEKLLSSRPKPSEELLNSPPKPSEELLKSRPKPSEELLKSRPKPSEELLRSHPKSSEKLLSSRPKPSKELLRSRPKSSEIKYAPGSSFFPAYFRSGKAKEDVKSDPYERLKQVTNQQIDILFSGPLRSSVKDGLVFSQKKIALKMIELEKDLDPAARYNAFKTYWEKRRYGFITLALLYIRAKVMEEVNAIEAEIALTSRP